MSAGAAARRLPTAVAAGLACAVVALAVLATALAPPAFAASPCLGAAARDPLEPCRDPRLRLRVAPSPDRAVLTPNIACTRVAVTQVVERCALGVPADEAVETVAVIGDSHAAHWRAAFDVVARARRWRVLEIATPHCPLSTAMPTSGGEPVTWCPEWNRQVVAWLAAHPELRTVFVSNHTHAPIVVPPGRTRFEARVEGFLAAWQALPPSVQRIVVVRDPPIDRVGTHACVRRALRARRQAGDVCAIPRRRALAPDAGVVAAERLHGRGARVVDLTPHFCGPRRCFPVVGGVLVHRDVDHLTQAFARTLGPFVLRAFEALEAQ